MTETSAGKIKKEEHIFKSTSGVCDIHLSLIHISEPTRH